MRRAVRLATLGVCATLVLCLATPARAAFPDYTTWLFAEGSTSGVLGFEKELLLANPSTTPVDVTIAVFTQDGEAIAPFGPFTLAPLSRTGVNVRSIPGVGDRAGIALRVTATGPIIAERTMYWGGGFFRGGRVWNAAVSDLRGGHNEKGANAGARRWYFAEGEGRFFNTFVSVANPNAAPTRVRARYLDDAGNEFTQTDVIPANGRRTFWPTRCSSRGWSMVAPGLRRSSNRSRTPTPARRSTSSPSGRCTGDRGRRSGFAAATPR